MNNKKPTVFTGAGVAIITPFRNGKIDYESFDKIIEFQIGDSTDAIIVCGTTGEAATLSTEEHSELIAHAVKTTAGRVPVVAGTGSNDTDYCVELSRHACDVGAEALLLVTPYYNKANERGLIRHFLTVADATNKPIIVYNVPSRTGMGISLPVYREIARHERIVATKEASGDIAFISQIAAELGDSIAVYSGNDNDIVPVLSVGGIGVISVLSNVMPRQTHDIVELYAQGKTKESASLFLGLLPLVRALFCEVNPIPVKTAMAMMGHCAEEFRLPLCEMDERNRAALEAALREYKLI